MEFVLTIAGLQLAAFVTEAVAPHEREVAAKRAHSGGWFPGAAGRLDNCSTSRRRSSEVGIHSDGHPQTFHLP